MYAELLSRLICPERGHIRRTQETDSVTFSICCHCCGINFPRPVQFLHVVPIVNAYISCKLHFPFILTYMLLQSTVLLWHEWACVQQQLEADGGLAFIQLCPSAVIEKKSPTQPPSPIFSLYWVCFSQWIDIIKALVYISGLIVFENL